MQGSREFSSYYAEFRRYAAEVTWDEPSKLAALKCGTAARLKKHRSGRLSTLTTIDLWVESLNEIDMHERQYQAESSSSSARTHTAPPPRQYQAPRPQPQVTTAAAAPAAAAAPVQNTTATGTVPGPMDLSLAANHRRVSPEERMYRMSEGRCYRCGGLGHMVSNCPLGQQTLRVIVIQPLAAAAAVATPVIRKTKGGTSA